MMHYNELVVRGRAFCVSFKYRKEFDFAILQNACKRTMYFTGSLCLPSLSFWIFFSACFDKVVLDLLCFYTVLCSGLGVQDGVKIFTK